MYIYCTLQHILHSCHEHTWRTAFLSHKSKSYLIAPAKVVVTCWRFLMFYQCVNCISVAEMRNGLCCEIVRWLFLCIFAARRLALFALPHSLYVEYWAGHAEVDFFLCKMFTLKTIEQYGLPAWVWKNAAARTTFFEVVFLEPRFHLQSYP